MAYLKTNFVQVTYSGKRLSSSQTGRLIITTPFGGTETDKVKAQFDKIKGTTDTRISNIDSTLDQQQSRVNSLSGQLDSFISEAGDKINTVGRIAMANITAQENILSGKVC